MSATLKRSVAGGFGIGLGAAGVLATGADPAAADNPAMDCVENYGCSAAYIECAVIQWPPVILCNGDGEAVGYPTSWNLYVDYIMYGPGAVVIDSGRRNCIAARPCTIQGQGGTANPGEYQMCVHSWRAGVSVQPKACATTVVK